VNEPVGEHGAGAAEAFLGGLEDEHRGAGEIAGLGEIAGGAEQHRGMRVVAAGVHHAGGLRGPGQVGLLVDRQRVHVGPEADGATGTVALQHADDAGLADAGGDLEPEAGQFGGDDGRGAHLLEAKLGVFVQVAADRREVGGEILDAGGDGHRGSPVARTGWTRIGRSARGALASRGRCPMMGQSPCFKENKGLMGPVRICSDLSRGLAADTWGRCPRPAASPGIFLGRKEDGSSGQLDPREEWEKVAVGPFAPCAGRVRCAQGAAWNSSVKAPSQAPRRPVKARPSPEACRVISRRPQLSDILPSAPVRSVAQSPGAFSIQ